MSSGIWTHDLRHLGQVRISDSMPNNITKPYVWKINNKNKTFLFSTLGTETWNWYKFLKKYNEADVWVQRDIIIFKGLLAFISLQGYGKVYFVEFDFSTNSGNCVIIGTYINIYNSLISLPFLWYRWNVKNKNTNRNNTGIAYQNKPILATTRHTFINHLHFVKKPFHLQVFNLYTTGRVHIIRKHKTDFINK